jgi:hypothetical protein
MNVSNDPNLSRTAAINVLFFINLAVVFDCIYLGGGGDPIQTRGQTLLHSRYVCTSQLWMNHCVNTKDGTLLSAPLY